MMARCAVFDNAEGLQSSQDSHLARPTTSTKPDGLFTFEYRDNGSVRQLGGVELASVEIAHDEALRSAIDLLDDSVSEGGQEGWAVRVRDGAAG
jgi:hypothetical protein